MKYQVEVTINLPRDQVLELFQQQSFIPQWQEGFVSMKTLSGSPGEKGSKNVLTYDTRGKEMVMEETILEKNLPDTMHFLYEAKNVQNWANNYFIKQGDQTLWRAEHVFSFSSFMVLLGAFGKKMFIAETTKTMNAFKAAAERQAGD